MFYRKIFVAPVGPICLIKFLWCQILFDAETKYAFYIPCLIQERISINIMLCTTPIEMFPVYYFLPPVIYFLFPVSCFLFRFTVSCLLFPVSNILFFVLRVFCFLFILTLFFLFPVSCFLVFSLLFPVSNLCLCFTFSALEPSIRSQMELC